MSGNYRLTGGRVVGVFLFVPVYMYVWSIRRGED